VLTKVLELNSVVIDTPSHFVYATVSTHGYRKQAAEDSSTTGVPDMQRRHRYDSARCILGIVPREWFNLGLQLSWSWSLANDLDVHKVWLI
jgi:hypothetical protein